MQNVTSMIDSPVKPSTMQIKKRPTSSHEKPKNDEAKIIEFSDQTMENKYNFVSEKYVDEYVKAGFPPKICAQLVGSLCSFNRLEAQVLDIGCG